MFVGKERAPKITGMLIELPVDQIKSYMSSLDALQSKVNEATDLIDQAEKQGKIQKDPQWSGNQATSSSSITNATKSKDWADV